MRRAAFAAAVVLGVGAAACASILGIQDGILDADGGEAGVQICEADSGIGVDSSQLFVAADLGDDSRGCTMNSPCKTLSGAIAEFSKNPGLGYHLIYISSGNTAYNETVSLPPGLDLGTAGLEIQGGWHARGTNPSVEWRQVCQDRLSEQDQIANVIGSDNVTFRVSGVIGELKLTNIYIGSRSATAGESLLGILATGPQTVVTLTHVLLDVGHGGDGAEGAAGANGDDGPDGSCPLGDGSTPDPGLPGTGAGRPSYGPDGVQTASADGGSSGADGSNGARPQDGGCYAYATCAIGSFLCNPSGGTSCGGAGSIGCAGSAGQGGGPGQSGGSTVGILAAAGATVTVNVGAIKTEGGGNGGAGGMAGAGGIGSVGASGNNSDPIHQTCSDCDSKTTKVPMGGDGSKGGDGSGGGAGGGGAAGDSFAFINLDASIATDADIQFGAAGIKGDPGGASGTSGTYGP